MAKLSLTQQNLLSKLKSIMTPGEPMNYVTLKASADIKTFDVSFNSLVYKGYFDRYRGNGKNEFVLTQKALNESI